jgi:CPA2 family monovalent cation:H+ antiporter-2
MGSIAFITASRQLAIAVLSLGGLLWVGRPLLRALLSWISRHRTVDLFLLSALLLALGTAYIAERLRAAPMIGAFLAGVAVGESDLRHQVSEHLRPFRDMLVGLFFITVGMQVDAAEIVEMPLQTLIWLVLFVLAKAILVMIATRAAGYDLMSAARTGAILAHASEITLLILTQAMSAALLPTRGGQAMLIAAALSMGFGPLIIQHNRLLARYVLRTIRRQQPHPLQRPRPH